MEFENDSTQASIHSYLGLMRVLDKRLLTDILYQERRRKRNGRSIVFICWANFARQLAETKSMWSDVIFVMLGVKISIHFLLNCDNFDIKFVSKAYLDYLLQIFIWWQYIAKPLLCGTSLLSVFYVSFGLSL